MLKKIVALTLVVAMMAVVGCTGHKHVIGDGAKSGSMVQERQWYVLWGLVPLNNVDTKVMAGGATNYEIKTEQSFLDVVINIFTGAVTVYSRTVEVRK
jgi:hypothetical protein